VVTTDGSRVQLMLNVQDESERLEKRPAYYL